MADSDPKSVVARFWELYNTPEGITRTPELCAADCVHEQAANLFSPAVRYVGRRAQSDRIAGVLAAFKDWNVTPHEIIAEGERVAARYTWAATSKVAFGGFPAGGRLRMDASCFFTVRNGVIVNVSDIGGTIVLDDGDEHR